MKSKVRCGDIAQGILGNRVGVLHVTVGKCLHGVGVGTMLIENVSANFCRDIEGKIPGHGHQHTEHTDHGRL